MKLKIREYTLEQIENDFEKFNSVKCMKKYVNNNYGNKTIDYYTFKIKIKTVVNGMSFYKAMNDEKIKKKLINKYKKLNKKKIKNENITGAALYSSFSLHYKPYSVFKPSFAKFLYCYFKPKNILDPFMGWGARLLASLSLGINYTGIDTNKKLFTPLKKMTKRYNRHNCIIKLKNCDSSKVDYSKIKYDMVLTSPPYFNTEIFEYMPEYKTEINFINKLYIPVFRKTYTHLKKNGWFCINSNKKIYNIIKMELGRPENIKFKIPLQKIKGRKRTISYTYCWKKN